jgi:hypothetical protein
MQGSAAQVEYTEWLGAPNSEVSDKHATNLHARTHTNPVMDDVGQGEAVYKYSLGSR